MSFVAFTSRPLDDVFFISLILACMIIEYVQRSHLLLVAGEGFEPSKAEPGDLQSIDLALLAPGITAV